MKELLFSITKKDFKIDWFSGTGAGGQKRNKTQNCLRLHHIASGVISTGQSNKERKSNIKEALEGLIKNPKFKMWHASKVKELLTGKSIEQIVNELIADSNLKIEIKDENGRWVEEIL